MMNKKKPLECPKCKSRLFRDEPDGSRYCAKCGSMVIEPQVNLEPKPSPAPEAKMFRCPSCGSENPQTSGKDYCECGFCGNKYPAAEVKPRPNPYLQAKPKEEAPLKGKTLDGKAIFDFAVKNTVEVHASYGVKGSCGTGFFFAQGGYILTNAHVVFEHVYESNLPPRRAVSISVNYKGMPRQAAELIAYDTSNDMAILQTSLACSKIASIAKKMPDTGEEIFAVGNSAGEGMCILQGIVADQLRTVQKKPFMMISANIVGGNSGGPIFNKLGEVVGIVTLGSTKAVAMNYGIPVTRIESFLLETEGKLKMKFRRG